MKHRVHGGRPAIEGDRLEDLETDPPKGIEAQRAVIEVVIKVAASLIRRAHALGLVWLAEHAGVEI